MYAKTANISEIDKQIEQIKKIINELIEQGMNGLEKDSEIDIKIAEQGHLLKQLQEAKNNLKKETGQKRLNEIQKHIENSNKNIKEFDNTYMRKMVETINVYDDATIEIHFKFGGVVRKKLEKASARR